MDGKDRCKGRLEAATKSGNLYLFDQGNLFFLRLAKVRFPHSLDICQIVFQYNCCI